jgi:hypothetical protein
MLDDDLPLATDELMMMNTLDALDLRCASDWQQGSDNAPLLSLNASP